MATQRPPEERLFNLVLALLLTEVGLTKSQIMATVSGYAERTDSADAALEQLFQRDKDQLRDLGIRVDVLDTAGEIGNNQNARYRISRDAYELPPEVRLTSSELALLALAAEVWREGSYSEESRRALTKLRGLGVAPSEPIVGFLPFLRAAEGALEPLRTAIAARQMVEFDYQRPDEHTPSRRRVSPLALLNHEGRWHLLAAESDGTRKTFLLRRMLGRVVMKSEADFAAEPGEAEAALASLREFRASSHAVVHVVPGSDAAIRLTNRGDTVQREPGVLDVHWTDLAVFADELVAMHPEVTVVTAGPLRDRVIERLQELQERHG